MKKLVVRFLMLLFVLGMSANAAWADDSQPVYLAAFKAQTSDASTGAGKVKLTWVDAQGKLFDNTAVAWLNYNNPPMAMPYGTGNPSNGDNFAETALMVGATLTATESVEDSNPNSLANSVLRNMMKKAGADSTHLFMTPYAYFKADAQGDNGSYFEEWTFNDARVWRQDTAMDKSAPESAYFKVLPNSANVMYMTPPTSVAGLSEAYNGAVSSPNIIKAVFKKYLLANPVATSANMEAVENETADLTVTVEINGEAATLDAADFATFTFTNNGSSEWTSDLSSALAAKEVVSAQKTRITIPVVYTYKNTGYSLKNTTMTISMAGASPSTLNVNLSVDALNPNRPEAYWFDGETEKTSGNLSDMLTVDISGYTKPILKLNKPVTTNLTFLGKDFTLDLNGNTAKAITVSSGNVTIAFSKYGGSATSLEVNGGKAILNGGTFGTLTVGASGTVEQNGATITGAASNAGSLTTTQGTINGGLTSSLTLVMNGGTFKGTTAVTISGGTAAINRGTIEGTTCGLKVTGGEATTKKLAAIKGATYSAQQTSTGVLTVESGKFDGPLDGTIDFTAGFFKTNTYGITTTGLTEMNVSAGVEYNEGYRYFLGIAESALVNGVGVCRIGDVSYLRLEDAIAYANNNPNEELVIFMTNNYTLPAGYYTIPAKATLVVPMSDTQAKEVNQYAPHISNNTSHINPYVRPYEFRRLTFANGVNMDVFGNIEVTGTQFADQSAYTSQPCGAYGHIVMEEGSHITLMANSEFRAWGFVTGKGEMDARRDSKVREMFQLGDWKGAFTSVVICGIVKEGDPLYGVGGIEDKSDNKVFPVTQYWIQNIESPVKYHPGAVLATSATVTESVAGMPISMVASDILVVGVANRTPGISDPAIFLLENEADAENTWIRKWYDAENDIQVYEINSAAHIGSMELDMGTMSLMGMAVDIKLNSALFDLPITSNMKIHLLSGSMDFQQNTCLLPGTEVEVDKEATVTVSMASAEKTAYQAWVDGGKSGDAPVCYTGALYVYDKAQWDTYAFDMGGSHGYTKVVRYAPSWEGKTVDSRPNIRHENVCPASAKINVRGTFDTDDGYVYTTEGGANIFSSNDNAGTFIFRQDVSNAENPRKVYQVRVGGTSGFVRSTTFDEIDFIPANLKNGDGSYTASYVDAENYAKAGDAYCYQNDEWSTLILDPDDPCFMVELNANGNTYYAKPQEYVAVVVTGEDAYGFVGNTDHTFSDAAGAGRLFILTYTESGDCDQWWEVEKKDNLYHCIHPQNDTYYYWDNTTSRWKEKTFTITWKNWNGDIVQTADKNGNLQNSYSVTYGTLAEFIGTNPTREKDADSTYNFTGWKPALGPVTQDVTYTATFQGEQRKYTIIFQNEGGTEIERQFLTHNEVPVCENTPTKVGHILQWSPAIGKVVADATYVATWLEAPPTKYEIRFLDYDGAVLKADSVEEGQMPTPPAYPANKPATAENNYSCSSWDADVVAVTEAATYTAVYTPTAKTFTVIFQNEDGSEIERHDYSYGETPLCLATPTKANTAEWTYGFAWTPQIQTVQAAATYRATFPATKNKYTVTLQCNLPGKCTFTGAGIYDYGTSATIAATPAENYEFVKWQERAGGANLGPVTVNGDITLTAVVKETIKDDPVDMTVGINTTQDVASATDVMNLTITSNGIDASSQLTRADNITLYGNADFVLSKDLLKRTWYCVAVPWRVEVNGGIIVNGKTAVLGTDIEICYYDGAVRAAQGKVSGCWVYMKNLSTKKILEPGKAYMIALLKTSASSITFRKKVQEPILTTGTSVQEYPSATATDAGWNAIANPSLFHAFVNAGSTDAKAQRYNSADDSYGWFNLDEHKLVVGEPIYVQAPAAKSIVVANGASYAPRRANAQVVPTKYEVSVTAAGATKYADHLSIALNEDKEEDQYIIGQDLVKFGVSAKVAQMWIDRYDAKLCVNAVAPEEDATSFPMSLFAPKAGNYTIAIDREVAAEDYNLYLTYNGQAIWNLSDGAYAANLNKGTDANYGLRISLKAPQVTTGVDEAIVDAKGETRKVLINNQVFIIRGEKVYTIDGQMVK